MSKGKGDLVSQIRQFLRSTDLNKRCADCLETGPTCINLNFKTFVCTVCAGIHREFGHKVKGISMTQWTNNEIDDLIKNGGNDKSRKIYLANWNSDTQTEPSANDTHTIREHIKAKYIAQKWADHTPHEETTTIETKYENEDVFDEDDFDDTPPPSPSHTPSIKNKHKKSKKTSKHTKRRENNDFIDTQHTHTQYTPDWTSFPDMNLQGNDMFNPIIHTPDNMGVQTNPPFVTMPPNNNINGFHTHTLQPTPMPNLLDTTPPIYTHQPTPAPLNSSFMYTHQPNKPINDTPIHTPQPYNPPNYTHTHDPTNNPNNSTIGMSTHYPPLNSQPPIDFYTHTPNQPTMNPNPTYTHTHMMNNQPGNEFNINTYTHMPQSTVVPFSLHTPYKPNLPNYGVVSDTPTPKKSNTHTPSDTMQSTETNSETKRKHKNTNPFTEEVIKRDQLKQMISYQYINGLRTTQAMMMPSMNQYQAQHQAPYQFRR